jgi:DNA-binding response OmpR family regulator
MMNAAPNCLEGTLAMSEPVILVAEDEKDIRDLIVFSLQIGGLQAVGVNNGEEAIELAPKLKPDLILLDIRMPRLTGYDTCRILKEHESTADIPIVFLSAKGQADEIKVGLDVGAVEYIVKPFVPEELPWRIKKVLAKFAKDLNSETGGRS